MHLIDSHIHTCISPDSDAPLDEVLQSAAKAGLTEIYVTDHCDLLDWYGKPCHRFDWAGAKAQFRAAGGPVRVRLGLELGCAPVSPADARWILRQGGEEMDFVLGSIHNWVGAENNVDMYFTKFHYDSALCRRAMENYLDSLWQLVSRCPDCYDSLAHLTYPIRYMERDGQTVSLLDYAAAVKDILGEVASTGHALEVNTNRGESLAWYELLLGWFRERGGKYVTAGSDAHIPADVGKGLAEAYALIKRAGFDHVTAYVKRQPVLYALD